MLQEEYERCTGSVARLHAERDKAVSDVEKVREELERCQSTLGKLQLQQEKTQQAFDKAQNEVDRLQDRLDKALTEARKVHLISLSLMTSKYRHPKPPSMATNQLTHPVNGCENLWCFFFSFYAVSK